MLANGGGFTIDTVFDFLEEVKEKIKDLDPEGILVFRGESKDNEETKLTPSIFRKYDAGDILRVENIMLETLVDFKISSCDLDIQKAMDSQHYAAVSRLLDVSFNCLTALYFAIEKVDPKYNPIVYLFSIPRFLAFSPNSEYLENYYRDLFSKKENVEIPQNYKLILFSFLNERVISQDAGFILFPGNTPSKIPELYYEKIEINVRNAEQIKCELRNYFNITESKIFPGREKSKDRLQNHIDIRHHYVYSEKDMTELRLLSKKLIYELKRYRNAEINGKISQVDYLRMQRKVIATFKDYVMVVDTEKSEVAKKMLHSFEIELRTI